MSSLYERVLGDQFDKLPEVLQRFHSRPHGGPARGVVSVIRGKGRLRDAMARLMRLPPAQQNAPLHLRVVVEGGRERWVRDLGGVRLDTIQWARGERLIEAAGPLRVAYRLTVEEDGLRLESVGAWLYALPLPASLAPRIRATEAACDDRWRVNAHVEAPLLGLLLRYEAEVIPE